MWWFPSSRVQSQSRIRRKSLSMIALAVRSCLRIALGGALLVSTTLVARADSIPQADLTGFRQAVAPLLKTYCYDCHSADHAEANLALDTIDPDLVSGQHFEHWRLIEEQLRFGEMPPADSPQPAARQRQLLLDWIRGERRKTQSPYVLHEGKLVLPQYGNYVDHEALFDEPAGVVIPAAPRLWRLRPEIYERFAQSVGNRPTGLSQPFAVLPGEGFKDYSAPYTVDESATDLLLRNAELIVDSQTRTNRHRELVALVDPDTPPTDEALREAIVTQFRLVLRRAPSDEELARFVDFWQRTQKTAGHELAGRAVLTAVLMQPEAVFRFELGEGPLDEHGRRRLSQAEIAAAVSLALDHQLDSGLVEAARRGELADREAVAQHVRRLLDERDNPRIMQFFREYFGYPRARDVFKDRPEFGDYRPQLLINDLEHLISRVLEDDREVLRTLLTTNQAFVDYEWDTKRKQASRASKSSDAQIVYGLPPDWKWTADQPIELPADERSGVLTHPAWLVAWSGNFDNDPVLRGYWIRTHLLGGTVPDLPIGVDAQIPEDPHKTLRERLDLATHKAECWRCHRKMNPLGLPFEQYDHYGHFRGLELERPVVATGSVSRTGFDKLDGPVDNPVSLLHRLANSPRVEQVFVRHVFRYFLGRNETLGDAGTLQQAHRAYRASGGSFRELVVALLASDSFLYRYATDQTEHATAASSD